MTHICLLKSLKILSTKLSEGFKHSDINAKSPRGPIFTHNICIKTVLCSPETFDPRKSCISHALSILHLTWVQIKKSFLSHISMNSRELFAVDTLFLFSIMCLFFGPAVSFPLNTQRRRALELEFDGRVHCGNVTSATLANFQGWISLLFFSI